jgi:hypothetical protein
MVLTTLMRMLDIVVQNLLDVNSQKNLATM